MFDTITIAYRQQRVNMNWQIHPIQELPLPLSMAIVPQQATAADGNKYNHFHIQWIERGGGLHGTDGNYLHHQGEHRRKRTDIGGNDGGGKGMVRGSGENKAVAFHGIPIGENRPVKAAGGTSIDKEKKVERWMV